MVEELKQIYEIRNTEEYRNANSLWNALNDSYRWKLEAVIGKRLYNVMVFVERVMIPLIENNCELAFDNSENGFSYQIGCYFQNKKYSYVNNVEGDIKKFTDLRKVYNSDKFPKEVSMIDEIIINLGKFVNRCKTYELNID